MKYVVRDYELYELGDEIHPGFHVGDKIVRPGGYPEEGWVSNIKTWLNEEKKAFVITMEDPNKMLKGDRPEHLCHGDWVMTNEVKDVRVVECNHVVVTDEEVAELFGLTLLEMIPEDDSSV